MYVELVYPYILFIYFHFFGIHHMIEYVSYVDVHHDDDDVAFISNKVWSQTQNT